MHTILYVDDEPGLLEIGKLFLERDRQFSVDTVTSAPEALTLLDTKNYDAIVADYQMPDMDGIEFLKKVRTMGNTIPFILFTGRGREEIVIQALNAGADFYLQKGGEPVSQFAELAHQIRQAIHKSKADASIRDHERREADIINFLPDATFAIDRSGHIIAWNRAIEKMTGVPAEEMLGKGDYEYAIPFYGQRQPTLIDLIFEPDEVIARMYAHILHRKETLIADTTLPLLRGQRVTLMAMASPLYNRQGKVVGAIESIRDITERTRAEDALRESEERYRQIVETANEGILKMDEQFNMVYVNKRMADMLGYMPEETIGRNIHSFFLAEDIPDNIPRLNERRAGKSDRFERRFVTKDGRIRWMQVSATPLMDPDGTFRGSFAMCSDITERKTAEMEITRRNAELRAAYEQLTATEEELKQNYDEQAKSQHLLRESEQRYRNVVEDQTEFICRFLSDGTHVFVNDAYCRYFGMKRHEILGHRFRPKIPAEDRERVNRFFASLTPDHPVDSIEHRIIMPDGTLLWQRWSDRAIFDPSGTITEYQSVGRDITDEKVTQTALQESEKRLNSILNTVGDVIFQLAVEPDGQYRFTSINSAFSKTTGLPYNQLIGKRVNEVIPEPSLVKVLEKYRQAIEEKAIVRWEEISSYPAGELTGEVSIAPIFDKAGKCTHLIGSVHDITGRKRADAALRESEKRFRELSDLLPQIIYEADTEGNLMYSNRIAFKWFGYTEDDFRQGLNIMQMIAPDDRERAVANFRALVRRKEPHMEPLDEYLALRKDGSTFPISIYSSPILVNGRITGLRGIIVDITERMRTENALRHANSQLNLLTGITRHDILNKVSVALGYLSIVQMKSGDPALVEYLKNVESAITTIRSQIEFTRIYQDFGIQDPQWIELDSVMPREVPVTVRLDTAVQGITVFADPMLEKVFFNLLDNSIRHGERVTEIRVSFHRSGDDLVIVWEDNGSGITADDKKRIFERGFGKNTGLGLFLVREILSLTDITITETGEPGKGARFEITLPKGAYRFFDAQ